MPPQAAGAPPLARPQPCRRDPRLRLRLLRRRSLLPAFTFPESVSLTAAAAAAARWP